MNTIMRVALLSAAIATHVLGGCSANATETRGSGYAAGSLFPTHIRSIAIPIAENTTFVRDVEFEFTDALLKEVTSRTPYEVTAASQADSMLETQIRAVELDQLSKSRLTGLGEEVIVSMTIDFKWTDLSTQSILVERRSFTGHGLFSPSNPVGQRIEIGRIAAIQQLARDLVDEMQAPW